MPKMTLSLEKKFIINFDREVSEQKWLTRRLTRLIMWHLKFLPPKVLKRLFLKESSSTFSSPDCIEKAVLPKLNWFLLFDIIGET